MAPNKIAKTIQVFRLHIRQKKIFYQLIINNNQGFLSEFENEGSRDSLQ